MEGDNSQFYYYSQNNNNLYQIYFKRKNKNVNVVEVDCDKEKELAKKFNVRAYPTVYLVKGEERTEMEEGISVNSLNNLVRNN